MSCISFVRSGALLLLAGAFFLNAQDATPISRSGLRRDAIRPHPPLTPDIANAATHLPVWQGTYTYRNRNYSYIMVGSDPSKGSHTTTVPVYIVPLKLTFSDGTVFDSLAPMYNLSYSATSAILLSPVFQPITWTAGSTTVGTTQYIDAFQRANYWSSVSTTSPGYHVLLGIPTILPEQSYTVPASQGFTQPGPLPGTKRAQLSGSFLDNTITPDVFGKFPQITPDTFTIFLTFNVFPENAYGFHDVWRNTPGQGNTYTYTSYLYPWTDPIDADISTLSHEVAEWVADPYVNNRTPCGLLEVGDAVADVIFPVQASGLTWHPQDLIFTPWFTFEQPYSVNGWFTFENTFTSACTTN
jgi:hypothetical protein